MPVIARFCGIVMRLLIDRTFGTHVHAFFGEDELIIGLDPVRVIQGEAPEWVREKALLWVIEHRQRLLLGQDIDLSLPTPISRQAACQLVFRD